MQVCWKAWSLARQAKDKSALVRERAIRELGDLKHPRAVKPLAAALSDANADVQLAAAEALCRNPDVSSVIPLVAAIEKRHATSGVQQAASRALIAIGGPAIDPLLARFAEPGCTIRAELAEVLGKIKDSRAIPGLVAGLKDSDIRVRKEVIHALGCLGNREAIGPLIAELKDERWLLRAEAADALGKICDVAAVDPLLAALGDEKWLVTVSVANALALIGDVRAVPHLIQHLKDPTDDVRAAIAATLGKLGQPQALGPLVVLLSDSDVAESAVNALKQLLTASADQASEADLEVVAHVPDPAQKRYEPDDTSTVRAAAGGIRQAGTRKVDCAALRQQATAALAKRRK